MLLISHIIIALGSILATSITYVIPSQILLRISYAMIASTLLSGTMLVVTSPVHMLQVCISGLTYVVLVSVGVFAARRKLALRNATTN